MGDFANILLSAAKSFRDIQEQLCEQIYKIDQHMSWV